MSEFHHEKLFERNPQLISGNLQIIACAGAGKTEFVSERIAYQVFKGIAKPDQISAFTFTEKAAEELKFRVRSKIKTLIGKQTDIGDIYIGTIHAFAFRILQEFIPRYRAYDMLDEVGRLAFLSSIRRDIDLDYLTNSLLKRFSKPYGKNKQNWVFRTFIRDVDIFREEGLSLDCAVSDSFRNAYDVYLRKLEEKRFLDFSSILRITVNTLKQDKKVRDKVHSQFKFFTVDEYQDVNPIQEELIQLVSNKKNVCIVGDDDQSIYQWRGADTSNILTFRKRYKDVATHELLINRRSHDAIVKASNDLITTNKPRIPKSIRDKGTASEPGDLYKIVFDSQDQEIEWLLRRIQALVDTEYMDGETARKLKYSDIALLFRSISNEASPYIEALNAADIPIVYSGTGGLFDTDEVSCIIRTLEYISECDADADYSDHFMRSIHDDISRLFTIPLKQFKNGVLRLKEWAKGQKRLSLQGLYGKILSLLGLSGPNFHEPEDDLLLYNLGRLSQAISDYENSREYLTYNSIKDFIWFIRLHAESSYDSGNTDAMAGLVDAVQIITMHGTKGLGFPVVFMPSHFKRNAAPNFGPTYIDTEQVDVSRFLNHEQDERRLYYVAMTRAKKYLFITSAEYKVNGKRRSTRNILFDEIPGKYFIAEPTPDPTKRKPCNIDALSEEIRFPTNYSELAYYLSCGYDYKMRFLFGFNPGVVPQLGFGKQVHNVINLLHKEYEDTKKIPSKKRILDLLDEHFYLRYASDYVTNDLKKSARSSLERYVKMWEQDFTLSVKTERAFELEFDNALIAGSIDMIKRVGGDEAILEIIDFKTGKPDPDIAERYDLQVQLYSIAAREALDINTKKALIHYLDAMKNARVVVETTDHALKNAKEQIGYALKGITSGSFRRDARKNDICKGCDWCHICPKRKGYRE